MGSGAQSELAAHRRPIFARRVGGDWWNSVRSMYGLFAEAIRTAQNRAPTFETAVELYRLIDTIKQASDAGRELQVA